MAIAIVLMIIGALLYVLLWRDDPAIRRLNRAIEEENQRQQVAADVSPHQEGE